MTLSLMSVPVSRTSAVVRRKRDHAGQGWGLTELDRVEVSERVEIDDHTMLAFSDLARQKAMPIARAWRALHVFRFHAVALLEPFEIPGGIPVSDHVLGNAAAAEMSGGWFHLHGVGAHPAVDDRSGSVRADLFLLEVADIASGLEKGAGFAGDIREDRGASPVFLRLALFDRPHGAVEL